MVQKTTIEYEHCPEVHRATLEVAFLDNQWEQGKTPASKRTTQQPAANERKLIWADSGWLNLALANLYS